MSTVFLNGKWCPIEQATVSVLDRGFIFGDGVYEVIPVYRRRPYRMLPHLVRLQCTLDGVRISNPFQNAEWIEHIEKLIELQPFDDQAVYIQVTRGVAPRNHIFPEAVEPTVFMMSNPLKHPSIEQVEQGISAISMEDQRWLHCDYKTTSLLGNVLAAQFAVDQQAGDVVQFRNGYLTEAASSNVLIVKDGVILAPQKNHLILHGITLNGVAEIAEKLGFPIKYEAIPEAATRNADEVWITSSTKPILPVISLDGQKIGAGVPGPLYKRVRTALMEEILS